MGRPNNIPIVVPAVKKRGDAITAEWANQLRDAVVRLKNRGTIDKSNQFQLDTVPPFWPTLTEKGKFVISDGFVVDTEGGISNTDCMNVYYPTGIGTLGGTRTVTSISEGEFIYIKCVISPDGVVITQTLEVNASDKVSFTPNPVARTNGEFWYKIAQYSPLTDAAFYTSPFVYYLAGSHIYLRHRGGNLDLRVNVDHISGGTISHVSYHYLVWRNGDYIGKFESTDTKPSAQGQLDSDTITYLA